ncbi:MAG: ATP-binding protein [Kiritimatiellales bacterium]
MKELVIISGKGGTGKTSITASFAALAGNAVFADCDVDAADLHLILNPEIHERHEFYSGREAVIREADCTGCGLCEELCRFEAVRLSGEKFQIDPVSCEGCGVCVQFCPVKAIDFHDRLCGEWFFSKTRFGMMVHARLGIGAENSGKLVSTVRQRARQFATMVQADWILTDGPPGTGCPVIASITGADAVLAVTEATLSGQHDLLRVIELAHHFKIRVFICVNKWDINPEMTGQIEKAATESGAAVLPRIPYDSDVTKAQINAQCVVEHGNGPASQAIQELWKGLCSQLQ